METTIASNERNYSQDVAWPILCRPFPYRIAGVTSWETFRYTRLLHISVSLHIIVTCDHFTWTNNCFFSRKVWAFFFCTTRNGYVISCVTIITWLLHMIVSLHKMLYIHFLMYKKNIVHTFLFNKLHMF